MDNVIQTDRIVTRRRSYAPGIQHHFGRGAKTPLFAQQKGQRKTRILHRRIEFERAPQGRFRFVCVTQHAQGIATQYVQRCHGRLLQQALIEQSRREGDALLTQQRSGERQRKFRTDILRTREQPPFGFRNADGIGFRLKSRDPRRAVVAACNHVASCERRTGLLFAASASTMRHR